MNNSMENISKNHFEKYSNKKIINQNKWEEKNYGCFKLVDTPTANRKTSKLIIV